MTTMETGTVTCLAVSKDGKWIAAGSAWGDVIVWDTKTQEKALSLKDDYSVLGVDFSPDSTRLVVARTATVWDIATCKPLFTLRHKHGVIAAKYSPQGDRIATASQDSLRVFDSKDGSFLVDIPVNVTSVSESYDAGLLWFNDHLFVISDRLYIKQFEGSTGLPVSEWPVPDGNRDSCIALPQHGEFISYSTKRTVTFWHTSTHAELGLIHGTQDIRSTALSPDGRFLAIGTVDAKLTVKNLKDVLPPSHSTLPFIDIPDTALDSWKRDRLDDMEASLTVSITNSRGQNHSALANRALVRAHLRLWDLAIDDAEKSINIRPSVIGYIAKSLALIGGGKKAQGCRVYDFVFRHCHRIDVDLLLLIKAVVLFMAGEHDDGVSRVDDLITTVHFNSIYYVVQAHMFLLLGKSHMRRRDFNRAIHLFERAQAQMRNYMGPPLFSISLISGWKFDGLGVQIQQSLCEAFYAARRTNEAGEFLLKMVHTTDEEVDMSRPMTKWVADFTRQCLSIPESEVSKASRHDEATRLSATLNSPTHTQLLDEWAKATLAGGSWKDALAASTSFAVPRFTIYRVIYQRLEATNRMTDASECFRQMVDELVKQANVHDEQVEWILGKLESLGDTSMSAGRHDEAISHYSTALSIDPAPPRLFIKRSTAYTVKGSWGDALDDANKVIMLDPSSPWGYERKHAALHKAGHYEDAINAFKAMLSMMSQSSDPEIRERHRQYVNPDETKKTIQGVVQDAIRDSPRMLIDTISGRLLDKSERAASFQSLPLFQKLISSMTTNIDHAGIKEDVTHYYRYAMFSHKWEDNEPLFEKVVHIVVYDLDESLTHDKLQMFCKIVRDAGLHWAWSDTCCINKADHFVLQEALVSMFKWYQGSAMTLVLLRGVRSPSRRGDLMRSIWNTRAWTFQEYHASKVVRFYNEDWTLYMNLDVPNHKESPEIISEMEEVTGISARALMALRPGLDDIREKLCLASRRKTTFTEDAAYSLLGIFSISLPIVYGEGDQALGRLLAQLLTSSGDTSILAWSGKCGSFNSCLPDNIIVFHELPVSHIPLAIPGAEMDMTIARMRTSSLNLAVVMNLYDQLNSLSVPFFVGQRMKLPCLIFKLGAVLAARTPSGRVFRARTNALGTVEISATEDLSRLDPLYLVHPWIDFLLDRQPVGNVVTTIPENMDDQPAFSGQPPLPLGRSNTTTAASQPRTARLLPRRLTFGGWTATRPRDAASLQAPSSLSPADIQMRALQVIARLRQPFGALLLTPNTGRVAAYRRVASESLITVRVEEITPAILDKLVASVRVLDVL
ncbi:WD40 repeat-like protein [Imleria badia]|nr:WD40 repeat-like protein [Imleria badia]